MEDQDADTDTREEIMLATYAALDEHGYANLTVQSIADEFSMTKAVLHYHYDTKEELLIAFLEFLLEEFLDTIEIEEVDDPEARLHSLIDLIMYGDSNSDLQGIQGLQIALLEIRSQAPHDERFREQFTRIHNHLLSIFMDVIEEGIEQGVFRDVDARSAAEYLLATLTGAQVNQFTTNSADGIDRAREAIDKSFFEWLKTDQ